MELIETNEDRIFLKLTIAKSKNKELLTEVGFLQSERDELRHRIEILNKEIESLKKVTPKERDQYIQRNINDLELIKKKRIECLETTIKEQKLTIDRLINEIYKLKKHENGN